MNTYCLTAVKRHARLSAWKTFKRFTLLLACNAGLACALSLKAGIHLSDNPNTGDGEVSGSDWSLGTGIYSHMPLPGRPTFISPPDRGFFERIREEPLLDVDLNTIGLQEDSKLSVGYFAGATDWVNPFSYNRQMSVIVQWNFINTGEANPSGGVIPQDMTVDVSNDASVTMVNQVESRSGHNTITHSQTPSDEFWRRTWQINFLSIGQNPDASATLGGSEAGGVHVISVQDEATGPITKMVPVPPVTIAFFNDGTVLGGYEPLAGSAVGAYKDVDYPPAVAMSSAYLASVNIPGQPPLWGEEEIYQPSASHSPTSGYIGQRHIKWYGPYANALPASVDRWPISELLGSTYNTTGGEQVGELVTYAVIPHQPPDEEVMNDVFQVAMKLGPPIARTPIYVEDSSPNPPVLVVPASMPSIPAGGSWAPSTGFSLGGSGTFTVRLRGHLGTLTIQNTAGVSITGNGTGTIDMEGTAEALTAALNSLVYQAGNSTGYDTLLVTALNNDGAISLTVAISIVGQPITPLSFEPRLDLPTGVGPCRVVVEDFDGDRKPDIAVANYFSYTVAVYRNISAAGTLTAGSFAPPVTIDLDGEGAFSPYWVSAADVDADGRIDLVVPDGENNRILIYQNTSLASGTIAFSGAAVSFATGTDPRNVVFADLDRDGRYDMLAANYGSDSIWIWRNADLASGSLSPDTFPSHVAIAVGSNPEDIAVKDLDGDGKLDLAVANFTGNTVSLIRNLSSRGTLNSSSFASPVNLPAPYGAISIAAQDMDGDCRPDLVVGSYYDQKLTVYRNQIWNPGSFSSGSFERTDFGAGGSVHSIAVGDITGDDKPDVVLVSEAGDAMSVFENQSTPGTFNTSSLGARKAFSSGSNPCGLALSDLDGDERLDVVFGNFYTSFLSIRRNVHCVNCPPTCAPVPSGAVGWWSAEGNATDWIGGNHGSWIGTAAYDNGSVGQSFSFDGASNVEIANAPALNPTAGLTVEAWVYQAYNPWDHQDLVSKDGESGNRQYLLTISGDYGSFRAHVGTPAGFMYLDGNVYVEEAQWYHVAMTYDSASGTLSLYVNGQLDVSAPFAGPLITTTQPVRIGGGSPAGTSTYNFTGLIDEPTIYNRALTAQEVQGIYQAGSLGKCQ